MKLHLRRWGHSQAIRMPKVLLELLGVEEGESFVVELKGHSLVLTPEKRVQRSKFRHRSLEEYLGEWRAEEVEEVNWGAPEGREQL